MTRSKEVRQIGSNQVEIIDCGRIAYQEAWDLQQTLLQALVTRKMEARETPLPPPLHHFLLCEHPPVYTLGRNGSVDNLLLNEEELENQGFTFYKINRGGDITYHGPGQLVGYPILDLDHFFTDIARYVRSLEEVVIRTLAHYHIQGERLEGFSGVWIEPQGPRPRKICAVGVHLSRWITMHGFALNVHSDLSHFQNIVPCGISDKAVTSMQAELGYIPDFQEVKDVLLQEFAQVFAL